MPVPILRAARGRVAAELPDPFPSLATSRYKVKFRRGQLAMLAGPPGAGKTNTAVVAVVRMGVPTLYVSADSDEDTMAARTAAAVTGHPVGSIMETISYGLFAEEYGSQVGRLPVRFVFDPSEPSIADVANALEAWVEIESAPPGLIIVDNLMNLKVEVGNEFEAMRQACKDLHYMARKSKACVLVLHHTSEQNREEIVSAPPRSAIQGKVSQLPSLILTMASNDGEMFVAAVKNRFGPQDPLAQAPVRMAADFTTCQIHELKAQKELVWAL